MAIKTFKPTTPSRRHMTVSAFEGIDKKAKPERSLTEVLSVYDIVNAKRLVVDKAALAIIEEVFA